jgi:TRAP-type C4-dicarboxylate transport system, small permease component
MGQVIAVLRKVDDAIGWAANAITAIAIGIQTLIMFVGVCFRYFFNSPLTWSDEISTFLLVLVTFFGSYVALRQKMLAKIEILVNKLPGMPKLAVMLLANLMSMVLLVAIAYFGSELVMSPVVLKQSTASLDMPIWFFVAIIPFSAVMMIVHMIIETYDIILRKGEDADEQSTGSYV